MRNKYYWLFIFFVLGLANNHMQAKLKSLSIVSYEIAWKDAGRLGDQLLALAQAYYLAWKYRLPFFRTMFTYDNQLVIGSAIEVLPEAMQQKETIRISNEQDAIIERFGKLYLCDFYFTGTTWHNFDEFFAFTRQHPSFIKKIRSIIKPVRKFKKITIPKGHLSIAVHIRKGGGYDLPLYAETPDSLKNNETNYIDKMQPLKFPPDSFYLTQIQKILTLFPQRPVYIRIFTDDKDPQHIVNMLKKDITDQRVIFDWRTKDNAHDKNVLDDLFNMARFDCLIRPNSSFSTIAQLIGNHKVICYPQEAHWDDDTLIVNTIGYAHCKGNKITLVKIEKPLEVSGV